jgi:hypothetical protein
MWRSWRCPEPPTAAATSASALPAMASRSVSCPSVGPWPQIHELPRRRTPPPRAPRRRPPPLRAPRHRPPPLRTPHPQGFAMDTSSRAPPREAAATKGGRCCFRRWMASLLLTADGGADRPGWWPSRMTLLWALAVLLWSGVRMQDAATFLIGFAQ